MDTEELKNTFKSIFTVEDTKALTPVRWNGKKVLEIVKISRKDVNKY